MALITLAIALLLERYFHAGSSAERSKFSSPKWFIAYRSWLNNMFASDSTRTNTDDVDQIDEDLKGNRESSSWFSGFSKELLVLVVPPLILLAVLVGFSDHFVSEVVYLAISVIVLVHCLGPESPRKSLRGFIKAIKENNTQSAYHYGQEFTGSESENWGELQRKVSAQAFRETETRYFAVVIWFALLGPAAALLYRLVGWYMLQLKEKGNEPSDFVSGLDSVLQWIPARISGIAYLLAGHMADGVSAVKKTFFDFKFAGLEFVEQVATASMGAVITETDKEAEQAGTNEESTTCIAMVRCALKLSERAGILIFAWVAIISLW